MSMQFRATNSHVHIQGITRDTLNESFFCLFGVAKHWYDQHVESVGKSST